MSDLAEFDEKFRVADLLIATSEHWRWSVRPVHSTLGAGVLSLTRFCSRFGDITSEESADLGNMTTLIEDALQAAFQPAKMNYIMLMMVDPHLHFHVLPRYDSVKEFADLAWEDKGWPGPPDLGAYTDRSDSDSLISIRDTLQP
jgi:diadenosine tetraphosphate (Ap4A) HIT family hydrolase